MKLALGTAQFGMNYGIANSVGQIPYNQIKSILNFARDNGIYTLDTARSYGNSENMIGKYIAQNDDRNWEIITKIDSINKPIKLQIEMALTKLNIIPKSILAHSAELFLDPKYQNQINVLVENNNISHGVSVYTKEDIEKIMYSNYKFDIIQLPINILDTRLYKDGILSELYKENIEIHARSVFLQGLFYLKSAKLKNKFPDVFDTIVELTKIANNANISLAELSLLWLLNLDEIKKIIIGVDSIKHLNGHLNTIKKKVDNKVFEECLKLSYSNRNILNPSNWT